MTMPPSPTPITPPKAPVRIRPKIGKNVLTCGTLLVVALLLILSGLAFAVAESGALRIPVFSMFYAGPQPTRIVAAPPMTTNAFQILVGSRLRAQVLSGAKPPFAVRITEGELTAAFESAIDAALKGNAWKRETTQVVIRPTDIELTGTFVDGPWHADLRVRLTPDVHDGGVSFTPVDVRIGDYPLPPSIAYQAVSAIFSRDLGTFFLRFENTSLEEVRLDDGALTVVAAPLGAVSAGTP